MEQDAQKSEVKKTKDQHVADAYVAAYALVLNKGNQAADFMCFKAAFEQSGDKKAELLKMAFITSRGNAAVINALFPLIIYLEKDDDMKAMFDMAVKLKQPIVKEEVHVFNLEPNIPTTPAPANVEPDPIVVKELLDLLDQLDPSASMRINKRGVNSKDEPLPDIPLPTGALPPLPIAKSENATSGNTSPSPRRKSIISKPGSLIVAESPRNRAETPPGKKAETPRADKVSSESGDGLRERASTPQSPRRSAALIKIAAVGLIGSETPTRQGAETPKKPETPRAEQAIHKPSETIVKEDTRERSGSSPRGGSAIARTIAEEAKDSRIRLRPVSARLNNGIAPEDFKKDELKKQETKTENR